jgi:hypothetical protein
MLVRVVDRGTSEVELGEPQTFRVRERREQPDAAAAEKLDVDGRAETERRGRARVGIPWLDEPHVAGELARQVNDDRLPAGEQAVQRTGDGRRRVDDEKVALVEEIPDVPESCVDRFIAAAADEQPHFIAAQSASFRRLVGFVPGVEGEGETGALRDGGHHMLDAARTLV